MKFHPCYLTEWLKKEPGALLVDMEREQLQRLLLPVLGDYLVLIGGLPELVADCPIRFKWYLNTEAKPGSIQVALDELPLANRSVDVIVIVHVLEFIAKPQQLIREACKALAPGGQIIIISLNPFSLWGVIREVKHYWTAWQVKNWLRQMRLKIITSDTFCFRPPLRNIHWWKKLLWLEAFGSLCFPVFGGFYILAAQKRASAKIPPDPIRLQNFQLAKGLKTNIRTSICEKTK